MIENTSPLRMAYEAARDILEGRDGAGFRFIVTLNNGKTWDVIPCSDDDLSYPKPLLFWQCEHGDNLLIIRHQEIAAIEVYEV